MSSFRSFPGWPTAKTELRPIFLVFFLSLVNYYLLFCHKCKNCIRGKQGGHLYCGATELEPALEGGQTSLLLLNTQLSDDG